MKIFITSIPRLSTRFDYVRNHIANISELPYETVGVDGMLIERDTEYGSKHNPSYPSPQIGCALSHVAACRRIVEDGLSWALVVEDDIVLPSFIDELLLEISKVIRKGEIISLYNPTITRAEFAFDIKLCFKRNLSLLLPLDLKDIRTAAAYIIENEAARKIVNGNSPVRFLADDFNSFYKKGFVNYIRIVDPTPCSVKPFPSSLEHFSAKTWKRYITDFANKIPIVQSIVALRRWRLRQMQSRNIVVLSNCTSPFEASNPFFHETNSAD